ncbi:MAG: hypothetical protein PHX04_04440 [Bacilli bacterium]|nr:hypothetical protein [Bacilli bacterium]
MDQILINIFNKSSLSKNFKYLALNLLNNYQDNEHGYICVGDAYAIISTLKEIEKDLTGINLDQKIIESFIFTSIKDYCVNEKDNIIIWKNMYETLIKDSLLNSINRNQILNIENPNSQIVSYLKKMAILVTELLDLMSLDRPYLVLKKYREIIELCAYQGLDSSLLEKANEEELKNILKKKYSEYSRMKYVEIYRKTVNERKVSSEEEFKQDNFVYFKTPDFESYTVQYMMYLLMKEYYKKTGFFARPLTRDIFLYYLKDTTVVAYLYDNVPKMSLKTGKLSYTWDDPHFWATVFNQEIDYVEDNNFNYFIDNAENTQLFKVIPLTFENIFYKSLGKKVIFTPEKDMDEAIFKSLSQTDDKDILKQLEVKNFERNNLMTSNNSFYFRDPTKVDLLEVENLEKHYYLKMIKIKTKETSRKRVIAWIISYCKKNPKQEEVSLKKKYIKNYPKEIRLPYKDN